MKCSDVIIRKGIKNIDDLEAKKKKLPWWAIIRRLRLRFEINLHKDRLGSNIIYFASKKKCGLPDPEIDPEKDAIYIDLCTDPYTFQS